MGKRKSKKSVKSSSKKLKKPSPAELKKRILIIYSKLVRKYRCHPTETQLQLAGVTRNAVRWHYGNTTELRRTARKEFPKIFKHIIDETVFTKKNLEKLVSRKKSFKRVVVTTAVAGCKIHEGFYKSLQLYCKKNKALMLIIPVAASASKVKVSNASWQLDRFLGEEWDKGNLELCFGDLELNSNIYVSGIKLNAKQIDPTTGMNRLGNARSFIYGSPKQRLKALPIGNEEMPHVAMGTGAITLPDYKSDVYTSQRTGYLAEFDHKLGAVIIELEKKDYYYFRQVQAESKMGSFVDLGRCYMPSGRSKAVKTSALVLGDWHSGETDIIAQKAWEEVAKELKPELIVIHDLFNGKSISHHEAKKCITKAVHSNARETSLRYELLMTARELARLCSWGKSGCVVVKSNHDDFLERYLQDGRFMKDHENLQISLELADKMINGIDPISYGVSKFLTSSINKKLRWLKRDEDFKIADIQCGAHGDKGPNGAKGTLANHEASYGACVIGHSHTPGILREAWQVGTSSYLKLEYNEGPSSWMHCSALIYQNGSRQLIMPINGKWRLK